MLVYQRVFSDIGMSEWGLTPLFTPCVKQMAFKQLEAQANAQHRPGIMAHNEADAGQKSCCSGQGHGKGKSKPDGTNHYLTIMIIIMNN